MSFWLQALLNLFEHGSTLKKVEVRQQPQIFILEMIDFVVFELLAFESSGGRENNKSDFKTPSLWKPTSPAVWVSWSLLVLQFLIWVLLVIKVWGGVRQGWGWPGGWQDCQMTSVSFLDSWRKLEWRSNYTFVLWNKTTFGVPNWLCFSFFFGNNLPITTDCFSKWRNSKTPEVGSGWQKVGTESCNPSEFISDSDPIREIPRHFSYGRVGDCWTVENVYQVEIPKQLALCLFHVYNICCNTYIIDTIYYHMIKIRKNILCHMQKIHMH